MWLLMVLKSCGIHITSNEPKAIVDPYGPNDYVFKVSETPKVLSPQATVCCYVRAAAVVHFRRGGPGLPNKGLRIL